MLTVGSICTGYGGIELALGLAGVDHRLQWVSEIDPTASAVLADHWPHVPNIGDINDANPEPVDLITAGFPCQDISVAGQQAGIHGERSGLWWRIRDVVGDLRPQWVLLENVAAITVNGGPAVVASLTELGYDCRWGIVRASDAGAPHQRARWFCLATNSDSERQQSQWRRSLQPVERDIDRCNSEVPADTNDRDAQQQQRNGSRTSQGHSEFAWGQYAAAVYQWEQLTRPAPPPTTTGRLNPRFVEWMLGLPDGWVNHGTRAAQLRCLGNGVVPQQAALALTLLADD